MKGRSNLKLFGMLNTGISSSYLISLMPATSWAFRGFVISLILTNLFEFSFHTYFPVLFGEWLASTQTITDLISAIVPAAQQIAARIGNSPFADRIPMLGNAIALNWTVFSFYFIVLLISLIIDFYVCRQNIAYEIIVTIQRLNVNLFRVWISNIIISALCFTILYTRAAYTEVFRAYTSDIKLFLIFGLFWCAVSSYVVFLAVTLSFLATPTKKAR